MSDESGHMTDARVMVTGARGFIGSHLVRRLQKASVDVHAVSRSAVTESTGQPGLTWHQVDLSSPADTTQLLRAVRPDVVLHLAGQVVGVRDPALVMPVLQNNLIGSVNLMTATLEMGTSRVVLAGSVEEPGPEESQAPSSPYSAAKWAGSGYARMFHELWDVPVTVLRVAMVYGPRQHDLTKLVPYVTTSLLQGKRPRLTSGSRLVDWVYVADVVDAFLAAAGSGRCAGHVVPIGSGQPVSIREVVEMISLVIGDGPPAEFGALPERPLDHARIADVTAADSLLGWKAKTSLRDGLAETVRWYDTQQRLGT